MTVCNLWAIVSTVQSANLRRIVLWIRASVLAHKHHTFKHSSFSLNTSTDLLLTGNQQKRSRHQLKGKPDIQGLSYFCQRVLLDSVVQALNLIGIRSKFERIYSVFQKPPSILTCELVQIH